MTGDVVDLDNNLIGDFYEIASKAVKAWEQFAVALVAARMDVRAWLATLSQRTRRIAKDLAYGFSTAEAARKYGVTAGRISQLRRSLEQSWAAFQQEREPAAA